MYDEIYDAVHRSRTEYLATAAELRHLREAKRLRRTARWFDAGAATVNRLARLLTERAQSNRAQANRARPLHG